MNLYFYVEGRRTEPKVYRSWLSSVFPQLKEVRSIAEVQQDNYLIVSGFGYPQLLKRIEEILADIKAHGLIDHFFVCLDAEEEPFPVLLQEIEQRLDGQTLSVACHAIIHNCCLETWFLGHRRIMRRNPQSARLREWRAFYDVSKACPELMQAFTGYRTRAHFHLDYLKEMLSERGLRYSKEIPGVVQDPSYLKALVKRYEQTGHLQSFGRLLTLWRSMGGDL